MPNLCKTLSAPISWKSGTHFGARLGAFFGVKTLRTQDTSDPRHFGTSAEVSVRHFGTSAELSRHFGTSAEVSERHFGTKEDTLAP